MLEFNKKLLDRLNLKERLVPIIFIVIFLVSFLYLATIYAEKKVTEYKNSSKTNMTGIVVSFAPNFRGGGNFCFVKLANDYGVMVRCEGSYYIGQQLEVIKTTKPSGEHYYEVKSELI